jgi:hypothetical protein
LRAEALGIIVKFFLGNFFDDTEAFFVFFGATTTEMENSCFDSGDELHFL